MITRWALAPALLAATVLSACGEDRPNLTAWSAEWEAAQALVPSAEELVAGGRPLCDELVGELRETLPELKPTPDEALDDSVDTWSDEAESIVFDCDLELEILIEELDELDVLAAAVDAGLDAEEG